MFSLRYVPTLVLVICFGLAAAPGFAAPGPDAAPVGFWDRDDGLGGVRIAPCGDALCGDVVWLKHPEGPAHVGDRLLFDMRATSADTWAGSAHNPEDGGTYAGTMVLDGDRLVTRGCVLAGLICRSVALVRARH